MKHVLTAVLTHTRVRITLLMAALAVVALAHVGPVHADTSPPVASGAGTSAGPSLALARPELKVTQAEFHGSWQSSTWLVFTVANTGNANVGPFRIYVKDGNGALLQVFTPQNGIAAGGTVTYAHKLPPFGCGDVHTRTVVADATHVVSEWNEGNNTATRTHIYPVC